MAVPAPGRVIVIDTDPGVDDALALMLALRSPECRVELITTVAGNVPVEIGTANARRILHLIAPAAWPALAQGAARPLRRSLYTSTFVHGDDGLGGLTRLQRRDGSPRYPLPQHPTVKRQAVSQLLHWAETYGQALTIVALGPLTNIARALRQSRETMARIGHLVVMGGAVAVPGNVSAAAEFNIFVDPHAADIVLTSGLPITLVPLDITRQVRLTHDVFERAVSGSETPLVPAIRHMTRHLLDGPTQGLALHDPLAVAVAIDPTLVQCTTLPIRVETRGEQTLGMTVADRREPARRVQRAPLVHVALDVDAERVLSLFGDRVLRHPSQGRPRGRVVVVGSANVDLTVRTPRLPQPGETVLGPSCQTAFGGKGANQALAARRAGAQVAFVGKLGQDHFGHHLARFLRQEGIDTSALCWDTMSPSGVALIAVDRQGQNQIVVGSGANERFMPGDLNGLAALLQNAQILVTQLETPLITVETALQQAKQAGLTTVLNPAPARRLPPRLATYVDYLMPNEVEAALLSGQTVRTPRQAQTAIRKLQQMGYPTVIITLGRRGLVYAGDHAPVHIPGIAVEATDTTAAGDTFVGYFACALAAGQDLHTALTWANTAAALSVTRAGAMASMPLRQDVERWLQRTPTGG